ncbi:MAG TPA: phosphate--acyl-ACP acyltransferase [bacterium]|nr:phosphate--acyl-ACP acyltransferase [bacterium]
MTQHAPDRGDRRIRDGRAARAAGLNAAGLRIAVDCMGGDRAPAETVAGALAAAQALGVHVLLIGVPDALRAALPPGAAEAPEGPRTAEIVPSGPAVPEGAPPLASLRALPNASMTIAMRQVREGRADAAVSAASTGPTLLAAVRELGMLEGVRRASVGRSIVGLHPKTFLIDLGPTMDCEAQHLLEFAVIGTTYMRVFEGIREPSVALLSNGREPGKGNRVVKQAAQLLARSGLNYTGLVEGHHFVAGEANVVVCDGFIGNAVLKTIEGLGREIARWLTAELAGDVPARRLEAVTTRLIELTNPIDLHGSLPLLGVRGNVVMAHGASDRHAIQAAIGQAVQAVRARFVDTLQTALADTRARLATTTPAV